MFTSPRTSCSSSSLLTLLWTTLSHARMSIMILNLINRSVNTRAECSARQEINSSSLLLCSQLYPLRFFVRFASLVLCRIYFVVWVEKTTISISSQCLSCIHILCSINIYRLPDNDSLSHSTIRLVFTISIEMMMMMMRATRKWFTFFPSSCMLFIKVFQSSACKIYVEREKSDDELKSSQTKLALPIRSSLRLPQDMHTNNRETMAAEKPENFYLLRI